MCHFFVLPHFDVIWDLLCTYQGLTPTGGRAGIQGVLASKCRPWQGLLSFYWPRAPARVRLFGIFSREGLGERIAQSVVGTSCIGHMLYRLSTHSKMAGVIAGVSEGVVQTETKKVRFNILPENMPLACFWFVFTNEITWCLFSFSFYQEHIGNESKFCLQTENHVHFINLPTKLNLSGPF